MHAQRITPRPGQESVWDYPRPPRVEPIDHHIQIVFDDRTIADTRHALRVLETSHPPVYYLPPQDVCVDLLRECKGHSWCEWKGAARYYSLAVGERVAEKAAWSYPNPTPAFAAIQSHLAFYAHLMDACYVDGQLAEPQPGNFYGGWITPDIVGPFKGIPGSAGW